MLMEKGTRQEDGDQSEMSEKKLKKATFSILTSVVEIFCCLSCVSHSPSFPPSFTIYLFRSVKTTFSQLSPVHFRESKLLSSFIPFRSSSISSHHQIDRKCQFIFAINLLLWYTSTRMRLSNCNKSNKSNYTNYGGGLLSLRLDFPFVKKVTL